MKLASVNVGLLREVTWHGRSVTTGIFKEPVEGRVRLRKFNLDGDRQADLTVHGPCYKLGIRFQSDDMVRRFMVSGRTGFYFAVTREGEVGAGDEIRAIARDREAVPVSEITRLYIAKRYGDDDLSSVRRVLRVAALPGSWKEYFRDRLRISQG